MTGASDTRDALARTEQIRIHHELAMALVDSIDSCATPKGKRTTIRQAAICESDAALLLRDHRGPEPSRSVLFRSAANLSLQAGMTRKAEKLACEGLAGEPPAEVAAELRDVLLRVWAATG